MKTIFVVYIALIVLAMSACQKKNDDAAVPPMGTDCVNNSSVCQTNIYQQNPGFYSYNQNYNSATMNNLCSCPIGTLPTYNNYAGLGCVDSGLIYGGGYGYGSGYNPGYNSGYGYNGGYGGYNSGYNSGYNASVSINVNAYAYFGWGQSNSQWNNIPNIPQVSNVDYGQPNSSCYNGVVQSCLVGIQNSCTAGYTCRPSAASSRLGLCTSNTATTTTGQYFR